MASGSAKVGVLAVLVILAVVAYFLYFQPTEPSGLDPEVQQFVESYSGLSNTWKSMGFAEDYLTDDSSSLITLSDSDLASIKTNLRNYDSSNEKISSVVLIYLKYIGMIEQIKVLNSLQSSSEAKETACEKLPVFKEINAKYAEFVEASSELQNELNSFAEEYPDYAAEINLNNVYFYEDAFESFISDSATMISFLEDSCQ